MVSLPISTRIARISPSATIAVVAKVNELTRQGIDVVSFAAGEPNFDTPKHIKAAAEHALRDGFLGYTLVPGILELREAICEKLRRDNQLEYTPAQITVANGAKQSLLNALMALCDPGDEVLLPTPCYVSFPEQVKLTGAIPRFVPTQETHHFRVTREDLEAGYTLNTKVLILNSPCNPTGAMCPREELARIAEFVLERDLWVVTDEIYERLVYNGQEHCSLASLGKEIQARTITVNGVSKSYAMTGWRLGYAAGPEEVIAAINTWQGHVTGSLNVITQNATIAALTGPQDVVTQMRDDYAHRRELMVDGLNAIPGFACQSPDGAFYAFPNVQQCYGATWKGQTIRTETDLVHYLLEEAHVAIVPGTAFGTPHHVRLTFAIARERIEAGLHRIALAINKLQC